MCRRTWTPSARQPEPEWFCRAPPVRGGAGRAAALENWQEQRPRSRSRSC